MCRFKYIKKLVIKKLLIVSIHPMCRFKLQAAKTRGELNLFQYILCVGSRGEHKIYIGYTLSFQYILCVGSSNTPKLRLLSPSCFNTSYVSVQENGEIVHNAEKVKFQYILCVGSSLKC